MALHNKIGKIGEDVATKYLESKNFEIIERNFHVKGGEIDIIARKIPERLHMKQDLAINFKKTDKNIVFVEVKTKKVENFSEIDKNIEFSPENNLSKTKRQRIHRAIKVYLSFKKIKESDLDIKIMAIIVFLDINKKQAKIKIYEDFIL